MIEYWVKRDGSSLFVRFDGSEQMDAATVVFLNALGTTHRIWDGVVSQLPDQLRIVRMDLRGHGKSTASAPPYSMGALIADTETVCDELEVRDAVVIGLSVGGMVAQGLAVKRLDVVRGLVLSNTAAKIGTPQQWQDRIDLLHRAGMSALIEPILNRWFSAANRRGMPAQNMGDMLAAMSPEGYSGVCAAISGTDFYTPTSGLRLPTLGIAGSDDRATPPDLVRETVELIPGSRFVLMRRCGHIPCVEDPEGYANHLRAFLGQIGH